MDEPIVNDWRNISSSGDRDHAAIWVPARVTPTSVESSHFKETPYEIILDADKLAGKAVDVALLAPIILSVVTVLSESTASVQSQFGLRLRVFEWVVTILLTVEYMLRRYRVGKPGHSERRLFAIVIGCHGSCGVSVSSSWYSSFPRE